MKTTLSLLTAYAVLVSARPRSFVLRAVDQLDQAAFDEAHPRDDTATRALSGVQIRTSSSSGQCLTVDLLSGDFRANLNPVTYAACGSVDGQSWDVITQGLHNDQPGQALIVNTLTQACLNHDPRRKPGDQVNMFSCGGRAGGEGLVADSQLFAFDGADADGGVVQLVPQNDAGKCIVAGAERLDIGDCSANDSQFVLGDSAGGGGNGDDNDNGSGNGSGNGAGNDNVSSGNVTSSQPPFPTTFLSVSVSPSPTNDNSDNSDTISNTSVATPTAQGDIPTANPTTPVPVSRAGGLLNPTDAAESHQVHADDTRTLESVTIKAPDGQCLSVDPTAGDFRENLIPIQLAECDGSPNQEWDFITAGVHNNQPGNTLIVSSLTGGCINFDGRRASGDTTLIFSCGGRAAGEGETQSNQLFPFNGTETQITLPPVGENGNICLNGINGRLDSETCKNDGSQTFTIAPAL